MPAITQYIPEHTFRGSTLTQLMGLTVRAMLDDPYPDAVLNIESHFYHVTMIADDACYELDVGKQLWLNKQRWSRLIREYVPGQALEKFIDQAREIVRGDARQGATANMLFRDPDRYEKKHRWGGCLMGATFHGSPAYNERPCLTFYSRTTYIGYMGMLDAAIGSVIAGLIDLDGSTPVSFRWQVTSCQLHCFKSLPFIFSQPDLMKRLAEVHRFVKRDKVKRPGTISPTWWNIAKWYDKVLEAYNEHGLKMLDPENEKYGPFRRIKRRWLEHMGHLKKAVPPSLPVSQLTMEKAE